MLKIEGYIEVRKDNENGEVDLSKVPTTFMIEEETYEKMKQVGTRTKITLTIGDVLAQVV